jgi:hypothetical protein
MLFYKMAHLFQKQLRIVQKYNTIDNPFMNFDAKIWVKYYQIESGTFK